ncbi:acyltransferase [Myxosarcina sp. GI1]|uniref:acyltransferase family protein n=1 Tax=Myxosarcina sp. GI1 TaxID=1541065 RepID=UPI00155A4338|nr:acyltransferase [Myxosarcina sp. GI1]
MGISILWIILYHLKYLDFGNIFPLFLFNYLKTIGYSGVDIFFLLSGFGLAFGWFQRKPKILEFYKKRLVRILPAYWIILFIHALVHLTYFNDFKLKGFTADLLGIGFLSSRSYNYWFIPSIIICYFLFPIIIYLLNTKLVEKKFIVNFWSILLVSTSLPLLLCLIAIITNKYQLLIFFTRLPDFILGVIIGILFHRKKCSLKYLKLNSFTIILICFFGFLFLFLVNFCVQKNINERYGFFWYPLMFFTFPLCLVLSSLCKWIDENFVALKNCLSFCGKYSLEIYLAHSMVFDILHQFINSFGSTMVLTIINITLYIICVSISFLLALFVKRLTNIFHKQVLEVTKCQSRI